MSMLKFMETFTFNKKLIATQVGRFNANRRAPRDIDSRDVEASMTSVGALGVTVGADVLQMMGDLRALESDDTDDIDGENGGKADVPIDVATRQT
jgi:hypothetical protein